MAEKTIDHEHAEQHKTLTDIMKSFQAEHMGK
jgi:hypothetical protein